MFQNEKNIERGPDLLKKNLNGSAVERKKSERFCFKI